MPDPELSVINNPEQGHFELLLGNERVGLADYVIDGDIMTVPHVETEPQHRGKGFAAVLMDGVVASLRANSQTIRPVCPYAAAYLRRRPETQDLVAL